MFLIECPSCQRRSIAGYAQLLALANSSTGPVALVRCRCGEAAAVAYGGRTHRQRRVLAAADASTP